jgi:hypothetical protein
LKEKAETDTMTTTYEIHCHPAMRAACEGRYLLLGNVVRNHRRLTREVRLGSLGSGRGRSGRLRRCWNPWQLAEESEAEKGCARKEPGKQRVVETADPHES